MFVKSLRPDNFLIDRLIYSQGESIIYFFATLPGVGEHHGLLKTENVSGICFFNDFLTESDVSRYRGVYALFRCRLRLAHIFTKSDPTIDKTIREDG